jgi:hypothetical protein
LLRQEQTTPIPVEAQEENVTAPQMAAWRGDACAAGAEAVPTNSAATPDLHSSPAALRREAQQKFHEIFVLLLTQSLSRLINFPLGS